MISMIEFYQCWGIIEPHEEQEWLDADNERHHENQEGSAHTMCLQHLWGYIFKKLTTNKCCAWEEIFSKGKIKYRVLDWLLGHSFPLKFLSHFHFHWHFVSLQSLWVKPCLLLPLPSEPILSTETQFLHFVN